ncbi:MAG: type II toxin-antitoxin system prevent-host-death family antitoxin [Spirochaetia bacterium]|nr:type II toxin-antitoxin system prevent-host-death family antitoxin [Spirochaetia bacterium]
MTVPLFDVKAKLSEYVTLAEQGEVVEITKYGKTSAVIVSLKEYEELKKNYHPSFIDQLTRWKQETGGLTKAEYTEFERTVRRNKEKYIPKENLF